MPIGDSTTRESTGFFHALGKVLTEKFNAPGNEKYKSAHNVISSEIWTSTLQYAPDIASASSYATGSPITKVGTQSNPMYLYPMTGTNYQTWFLDTGTPSFFSDGFVPSDGWVKPLINPSDVPNDSGAPSFGYELLIYDRSGNYVPYGNAGYDVDYYSGLVKFQSDRTPIASGAANGMYFTFLQSGFENPSLNTFALKKAYLFSNTTGGPRAVAFQYTGQYLQNIAENPAVGSEPYDVQLTALDVPSGTSTASNTTLVHNPVGEVVVFVNGQRQDLGYATTSQCFFGTQSTFARATEADVAVGDYLFWNADATNSFTLSSADELFLYYNKPSA